MKTKIHLNTTKAFALALCSFCMIAIPFFSCNKESSPIQATTSDNAQADMKSMQIYKPGDVFKLSGLALYRTWMVKGGKVLQNAGNPCVAELVILDKQNFKFTFTETKSTGPISLECFGKMAASGVLTFEFPAPIFPGGPYVTDIIRAHTCATIWGEGINKGTLVFKGKFDGEKFEATAYFMAKIEVECPSAADLFPTPVDGNLHWTFGYDLAVVN